MLYIQSAFLLWIIYIAFYIEGNINGIYNTYVLYIKFLVATVFLFLKKEINSYGKRS